MGKFIFEQIRLATTLVKEAKRSQVREITDCKLDAAHRILENIVIVAERKSQ